MSEMKKVDSGLNQVPMIYGLVGKAMSKIGAIGKDSAATNYSGKTMYKFRGIDAVYNALNPVMSELGLFIIPEVLEHKREERTSTNGSNLIYSIATVKFTMFAPDGSSVSGIVVGEGMDSGDKSMNKAMSIAMKYFCFQVFCIPTEEMRDPDAETHEVLPKSTPIKAIPASVTQVAKVPEMKKPDVNTVAGYIQNEIAFLGQIMGVNDKREMDAKFASMRKALVDGGVVPNVKGSEMTMEQAKNLMDAIKTNFLTDEVE